MSGRPKLTLRLALRLSPLALGPSPLAPRPWPLALRPWFFRPVFAVPQRVTELMLTSASAIEALAANELDADGFIEKAERYLQHIEVRSTSALARRHAPSKPHAC